MHGRSRRASITLTFSDVALNTGTWEASRAGRRLTLTSKEFRILEALMRAPDRVLTREDILSAAWQDEEAVESNVVDVHMASLRGKLESEGDAAHHPDDPRRRLRAEG